MTLPYSRCGNAEELFPAARKVLEWKRTSQRMKITVSSAEPQPDYSHAEALILPGLSHSFQAVRRSSKSPEKRDSLDPPLTPFSEVMEKQGDAKGAYPYLAVSRSKPRLSKTLSGPVSPARNRDRIGPVSCTCSLRLYQMSSLHYQQLFLRTAPSLAMAQHLPSLSLLWNRKCATCQLRAAVSRFGFSDRAIVVQPTKRLRKKLSLGACVRNSGHRVGSNRLHDGARL